MLPQLLESITPEQAQPLIEHLAWWMQEKLDGKRLLLNYFDGELTVLNKQGRIAVNAPDNILNAFPSTLDPRTDNFSLDGEWLTTGWFVAFDLLFWENQAIDKSPYHARYQLLQDLLDNVLIPLPKVRLAYSWRESVKKAHSFAWFKEKNYEGVVFKLADAPHVDGRSDSWRKCKFKKQCSVIVLAHNVQRSVVIGLYDGVKLRRICDLSVPGNRPIPAIGSVVEIEYTYAFPKTHSVWHPVLLYIRDDVNPGECTVDQLVYKREEA